MSPRKGVVERYLESFDRQDWPTMLSLLTDDVERHEVGAPTRIHGKKAFEANMAPSPDVAAMRTDSVRLIEEGSVVVSEGVVHLTKKDGKALRIQFCDVFDFEGTKIKRLTSFAAVLPTPS